MEVPQAGGLYTSVLNLHKNFLGNLETELLTHSVANWHAKMESKLSFSSAGCGSPSQDLLRATRDGDLPAVQTLLRCPGVDVNVQDADNYGYTPLINAAKKGDRQMVQVRGIV